MPSMTWLLESTSFSRGFLLKKIVGTVKAAGNTCQRPEKQPSLFLPRPICFRLAGAQNVICSPYVQKVLALARRNSELLCHFA